MTGERKLELYTSLEDWIFEHCPDDESLARAFAMIGYTKDELLYVANIDETMDEEEYQELMDELYEGE